MNINFDTVRRVLNFAQRLFSEYQNTQSHSSTTVSSSDSKPRHSSPHTKTLHPTTNYPGDFAGIPDFRYAPRPDGNPDPGEVVWAWVPYEENHSEGKDRPVIIVGKHDEYLLALMLTSKDRNNAQEHDSRYLDIGRGTWDRQERPSEVKLDRVIQLRPEAVRREGAVMDELTFRRIHEGFQKNYHQ